MKRAISKCSTAFTLIEVVIAMAVAAGTLFYVSNLQMRSLNKMFLERDKLINMYLMKRDLFTCFVKPPEEEKPVVNKIESPDVKLTTQVVDIDKKSVLHDQKQYIKILKTEGAWKIGDTMHTEEITSIVFKREKKEEKKQ